MNLTIYKVDSFTRKLFAGNPAAVCITDNWLCDELMQQIANENNLSETAFVVKENEIYTIRWFTPTDEIDLCGHATLAAAFVLCNFFGIDSEVLEFYSPRSGNLYVKSRGGDLLELDFPTDKLTEVSSEDYKLNDIINALGRKPLESYKGKTDYLLVFDNESEILEISPDFFSLSQIEGCRGVIITAQGKQYDFVSRFFAPAVGVNEDPVTGSAHTSLIPYWAKKLGSVLLCVDMI